jgi:hypothetical protein
MIRHKLEHFLSPAYSFLCEDLTFFPQSFAVGGGGWFFLEFITFGSHPHPIHLSFVKVIGFLDGGG